MIVNDKCIRNFGTSKIKFLFYPQKRGEARDFEGRFHLIVIGRYWSKVAPSLPKIEMSREDPDEQHTT